MYMKKLTRTAIAVTLVSSLFVMPVSAHGHGGHHGQTTQQDTVKADATDTSCPVCTVEGCTEKGKHSHDGHDYCGYAHEGGYCDGTCESSCNTTTKKTVTQSQRSCVSRRHCNR